MDNTPIEFQHDVESILARRGCNSGACHGALAGKGGFRLSLRGYDASHDHFHMTSEDRGRRIELADPGRSLLLAKPSGALPHQGGIRLPVESKDYQTVAEWIAQGANPPSDQEPKLLNIEVWPQAMSLKPSQQLSLIVTAKYDNGRVRDVSHWAKFSASDEAVMNVDESGRIQVVGPGQGAIVVWFGSQVHLAKVTVPYPHTISEDAYAQFPVANFIDRHTLEQWRQLRLAPSARSTDREFIRRAFLDTLGILPSPKRSNRLFAQSDVPGSQSNKRKQLIEQLLARPEFATTGPTAGPMCSCSTETSCVPEPIRTYYQWIRQSVAKNKPWDVMVREILTARGESTQTGRNQTSTPSIKIPNR